jgi:hypothetical protein
LKKYPKIFSTILLLQYYGAAFAQDKPAFGLGYAQNMAVGSKGVLAKLNVPILKRLQLNAEGNYFPTLNRVSEFNGSLFVNYMLLSPFEQKSYNRSNFNTKKVAVYALAGLSYNTWVNYIQSVNTRAKAKNFLPMVGLGLQKGRPNLRFFLEAKLNPIWKESGLDLGVLVFPGIFAKNKNMLNCPKTL